MKKLAYLLVVLVLMASSTALADEILFRDIPWSSTPLEFVSHLNSEGTYFDDTDAWDASSESVDIQALYGTDPVWRVKDVPVYRLERFDGQNKEVCIAAGYGIERISAYFLPIYNEDTIDLDGMGDSKLYLVRYLIRNFTKKDQHSNANLAYEDLLSQLKELYGEGIDASGETYNREHH